LGRVPLANDDRRRQRGAEHVYNLLLTQGEFRPPGWLVESDEYDPYMKSFLIHRMQYVWERAGWDIMDGLRYVCYKRTAKFEIFHH
jgi:hypothetical protein